MKWSIKIATAAGTEIRIHITFVIFLAWIGLVYFLRGGWPATVDGLIFILLIFLCVLLHEFGHALAARKYGIPTPDITLLPIGGVARLQRMPDKPLQEFIVALAGPAVNVLIALGLYLYLGGFSDLGNLLEIEDQQTNMTAKLMSVNVFLVVFNLLPAFPMDGGRILRALLAMRMNYARATQVAANIGQAIAFFFGFIGLFFNPLLIFIALFIYLGAFQEASMARVKEAFSDIPVRSVMVTDFEVLDKNATIGDAVDILLRTSQHQFPIVDENVEVCGILHRDDIIAAMSVQGPNIPVSAVMHRGIPTVRYDQSFSSAFQIMQEHGSPALPVVNEWGGLIGLISSENIAEIVMLQHAISKNGKQFKKAGIV